MTLCLYLFLYIDGCCIHIRTLNATRWHQDIRLMSYILDEVKGRLSDMIQRLQADIPGIRLGVIAHGYYCD